MIWPGHAGEQRAGRQLSARDLARPVGDHPARHAPARFSANTGPEEYRGGLANESGRSGGIDPSPLPEAIRQELAWCTFRIIARDGKVDVTHVRALTGRLGEVIADLGPAAPTSLAGLAPRAALATTLGAQLPAGLQPAPGLL